MDWRLLFYIIGFLPLTIVVIMACMPENDGSVDL
jgi:hypothetical protein